MELIFNFEMYSFLIKIAIDVKRAVELINTIPMFGLIKDLVEVLIADLDPNTISVIVNRTFFLYKLLYIFLWNSLSILGV